MSKEWKAAVRNKRKYAIQFAKERTPENFELKKKYRNIATRERRKALTAFGARQLLCFSAQLEGRTAATVWNWSGKTLSPGALLAVLYFSSCHIFPPI